jgi:starch synthase
MTPATDQKIAQRYTAASLEKKGKNKQSLQEELGWPSESKRPVICLPAGMSEVLGGALLEEILPGIISQDIQILILGKGASHYGDLFTKLSQEHPHRVAIIPNEEVAIRKMYAASDMALFLEDPADLAELPLALSYGVVPIAPDTAALEDYNPVQEAGNGFLYSQKTVWHCFGALVRAMETHRFPFDWRTIQKHCMGSVK